MEIAISKAIGRGKSAKLYLKSTKTGTIRVIKIDEATIAILKMWRIIQNKSILF